MPKKTVQGSPEIAVAYIRVSTHEQKLGAKAQRADIERYCAREGIQIAAEFVDEGISGGDEIADRPGLVAALASLRTHNAGVLIAQKRDRWARDVSIAIALERAAAAAGACLVTADGIGAGRDPAAQLQRTLLDAFSQFERAQIRSRIIAAHMVKRANNEAISQPPYGQRLAADCVHLEPDLEEQAVITRVRALRDGGETLRGIVAVLAHAGVVGRAGRPLSKTAIVRMLAR